MYNQISSEYPKSFNYKRNTLYRTNDNTTTNAMNNKKTIQKQQKNNNSNTYNNINNTLSQLWDGRIRFFQDCKPGYQFAGLSIHNSVLYLADRCPIRRTVETVC